MVSIISTALSFLQKTIVGKTCHDETWTDVATLGVSISIFQSVVWPLLLFCSPSRPLKPQNWFRLRLKISF